MTFIDAPLPTTTTEWELYFRGEAALTFDSSESVRHFCKEIGVDREQYIRESVQFRMSMLLGLIKPARPPRVPTESGFYWAKFRSEATERMHIYIDAEPVKVTLAYGGFDQYVEVFSLESTFSIGDFIFLSNRLEAPK